MNRLERELGRSGCEQESSLSLFYTGESVNSPVLICYLHSYKLFVHMYHSYNSSTLKTIIYATLLLHCLNSVFAIRLKLLRTLGEGQPRKDMIDQQFLETVLYWNACLGGENNYLTMPRLLLTGISLTAEGYPSVISARELVRYLDWRKKLISTLCIQ